MMNKDQTMMQAIVVSAYGGPEVLQCIQVPRPVAQPGEVLVRVHAAGVNPVDAWIRNGSYARRTPPYTPGIDGAGEIVALGEGVNEYRVGDRVYLSGSVTGTYAEYARCLISQVRVLPSHYTAKQGAGIYVPLATAYHALFHLARVQAGETVLVRGARGAVGQAVLQWCRLHGIDVIGSASTDAGRAAVRAQGARVACAHDDLAQLLAATSGRGADVIIETHADHLDTDFSLLALHGRIVMLDRRGSIQLNLSETRVRNAQVLFIAIFSARPQEQQAIDLALANALQQQQLVLTEGQCLPLAQAAQAHRLIEAGGSARLTLLPGQMTGN